MFAHFHFFFIRQHFFAKHKDNPPIAHNLPPFAGALTWSKGLLERVSMPMDKISSFDKKVRKRPWPCTHATHHRNKLG